MKNLIKVKLNADIGGSKAGDIIELKTDKNGNIRDNYWARRMQESELDGSMEIQKQAKPKEFKHKAEKE